MSVADAVAAASRYLTEHPDEARYRDSTARAHLTSGLVVEVTGPGGEHLTTDMPSGIGGTATAPSLGWMLRAAAHCGDGTHGGGHGPLIIHQIDGLVGQPGDEIVGVGGKGE